MSSSAIRYWGRAEDKGEDSHAPVWQDSHETDLTTRTLFTLMSTQAHPVLQILASAVNEGVTVARIVYPPAGSRSSRYSQLQGLLKSIEPPQHLLLVGERPLIVWIRRIINARRYVRERLVSVSRLLWTLRQEGWIIEASYALWPSPTSPRIAVPLSSRHATKWVHRSGVLGGGGHRAWLRAIIRSPILTPLMARSYPVVAILVRPPVGGTR